MKTRPCGNGPNADQRRGRDQGQLKWNEVQNTPRHVQMLANYLLVQYKARVWNRAEPKGEPRLIANLASGGLFAAALRRRFFILGLRVQEPHSAFPENAIKHPGPRQFGLGRRCRIAGGPAGAADPAAGNGAKALSRKRRPSAGSTVAAHRRFHGCPRPAGSTSTLALGPRPPAPRLPRMLRRPVQRGAVRCDSRIIVGRQRSVIALARRR